MAQNLTQVSLTGTYGDGTTSLNLASFATFTVSDTSIVTIANPGTLTIQSAGKIWGADVGVTATIEGVSTSVPLHVIASDSGSVAPKMPQLNGHWQALGLSPWGSWWGLQEGAGNAVGSGSTSLTLTATGAPTYAYTLPAWTRKFITLAQATTNNFTLLNVYGSPPNWDATGSMAMMVYGLFPTPSATVIVLGSGNANTTPGGGMSTLVELNTSTIPVLYCSGTTTPGTKPLNDGRVHPVLLVYDKTNSRVKLYTDMEKITGSFGGGLQIANSLTSSMGIGNASVTALNTASGSYSYYTFCTGSVAESLSDDGRASSFLKALGWSLPW